MYRTLVGRDGADLKVQGLDCLDDTPLLDLKRDLTLLKPRGWAIKTVCNDVRMPLAYRPASTSLCTVRKAPTSYKDCT